MASPWDDNTRFQHERRGFTMSPTGLALVVGFTALATMAITESMDRAAPASADQSQAGLVTNQPAPIEERVEFTSPPQPSYVHYRNCAAAWAAGAAPIYRGQPGYEERLDGDDDGIACEPYHRR